MEEGDELYKRDLKSLWVDRILKHLPIEESSVVIMHPYR
jgi:hypothetical protein